MLKDAVPTITHVMLLVDPVSTLYPPYVRASEAAAQALGIRLQRVDAGTPEAIEAALVIIATGGANALMIQDSAMFSAQRQRILDFARHTPVADGVWRAAIRGGWVPHCL